MEIVIGQEYVSFRLFVMFIFILILQAIEFRVTLQYFKSNPLYETLDMVFFNV